MPDVYYVRPSNFLSDSRDRTIITGDSEDEVLGKVYEYLRSGTPILCIGDRGSEMERILVETQRGVCLDRNEPDRVTEYLRDCYQRWQNGTIPEGPADDSRIREYERRRLTERLAEAFNRVSAKN